MPLEIIDNRIENIMKGVPTVDEALSRIDKNGHIQIDDVMVKYTEKIALAIEEAIKNCKYYAILKLDSDFHYLVGRPLENLCDQFDELGYRIIVPNPTELDIFFD